MKHTYVLDANALIAYISEEKGADVVRGILRTLEQEECKVFIHAVNLLEVYYGTRSRYGEDAAKEVLEMIGPLGVTVRYDIPEEMIIEAGRLKSKYKMSLADSIGVAYAVLIGASFVTSGHHELDAVDTDEKVNFTWIR